MKKRRNLFIPLSIIFLVTSIFSIEFVCANKVDESFKISFKEIVKSSLYYSLKKEETYYFEVVKFEKTLLNLIDVLIKNYEITSCKLEVNYVLSDKYVKGVNLWLNYQIKNYQKQISTKYVMNQ